MQNAALAAAGLGDWRYQLLPVPPELFVEVALALPRAGFRGANVTIPHKEQALGLAAAASARARAIGAANTLLFDERGTAYADNTDAPALIGVLPFPAAGRTALVLGAGGSARAVVWALLDAGAHEVRVWNRTAERARALCEQLGAVPALDGAAPADLLINCTAGALDASRETFKQLPVRADDLITYRCVIDLVYSDRETPLVEAARSRSVPTVDGRELLVGQGALSFELFTGSPAPVEAMRAAVHRT